MPNEPILCPDRALLSEFHEGRLRGLEGRKVAQHVEVCKICKVELAELSLDDGFNSELREILPDGQADFGFAPPSEPESDSEYEALVALLRTSADGERYQILGEIASGGMGVVYEVYDRVLRRKLAMKIARSAGRSSSSAASPTGRRLARFLEEVRITGQLDHPSIIPVHELGVDTQGRAFFTMRKVRGQDLHQVFEELESGEGDWTLPRLILVVQRACDAVAYAHSKGVVHRDLKPANIMVGRFGAVYVMDWGIAKVLAKEQGAELNFSADAPQDPSKRLSAHGQPEREEESTTPLLTLDGEILGTPAYMAPEQATGRTVEVGLQADVYSMGAVLYRLLSGRRPYEDDEADGTPRSAWKRLLEGSPLPLNEVAPKAPPELVSICERAMSRDPAERYPDVAGLSADLGAWLEGRVVRAHKTGVLIEVRKWVGRHRALVCVGAAVIAAVTGLFVRHSLVEARSQGRVLRAQSENTIRAGVALARAKNFDRALATLMPLEGSTPDPGLQAALDELFRRNPCSASFSLNSNAEESVVSALISPDAQWLVTAHERLSASEQESDSWRLRLWPVPGVDAAASLTPWTWEWESAPVRITIGEKRSGRAVTQLSGRELAWKKDERTVCVGGPDRRTQDIEVPGELITLIDASTPAEFGVVLRVQAGGEQEEQLWLCDVDGSFTAKWRLPQGTSIHHSWTILDDVLIGRRHTPWNMQQTMLSLGRGGAEVAREFAPGVPFPVGTGRVQVHHDSEDSTRMVVTSRTLITAWRCADGKIEFEGSRENNLPRLVVDSQLDRPKGAEWLPAQLGDLQFGQGNLLTARYYPATPDGSREPRILAVEDRTLRIWMAPEPQRLDSGEDDLEIARFEEATNRLWGAGGQVLTAWSLENDGTRPRINSEVPLELNAARLRGLAPEYCGIAFDPGRAILACARGDGRLKREPGWVFLLPDGNLEGIKTYPCAAEPSWIEFSPDRRQLAVAEGKGEVELWAYDSALLELTDPVSLSSSAVGDVRISCLRYLGERFLIATEGDHTRYCAILLWDLRSPDQPPRSVERFGAFKPLRCLAVSSDSSLVATGGDDRTVSVMRVVWREGRPEFEQAWLARHGAPVYAVAFTVRDGVPLLASGDRYGGIKLWDAETGVELGVLQDAAEDDHEMILSLEFSSDGRHLAGTQKGGRVLLWDMDRPRRFLEGNRRYAEQLLRSAEESR